MISRNIIAARLESYITNHPDDIARSEITPCDMIDIAIDEIDRLTNKIQELSVYIESARETLTDV